MAEEYLADHFPHFPVMPGVLMLEALTQARAWLVRISEDFAHSMVVLKQANNVKYGQFVEPGQTLTVTAELLKRADGEAKLKVYGTVSGRIIVSARLTLACYNLADAPSRTRDDRRGHATRFAEAVWPCSVTCRPVCRRSPPPNEFRCDLKAKQRSLPAAAAASAGPAWSAWHRRGRQGGPGLP